MACTDILCRTGDLLLPASVRRVLETYWIGNSRSLLYVTNWSLMHFLSGVLLASIGTTLLQGFWIHTIWELWQMIVGNTPWWTWRGRIDLVMDTVLFLAGMAAYNLIQK